MKAQIVSFHCVLKNKLGKVLSTSFNQEVINQLEEGHLRGSEQRLRGLIAGIQDVRPGDRRSFTVPANEAYGPYNPDLILRIPRSDLPLSERFMVGTEIIGPFGPEESEQVYRVIQITKDTLELDGNHPLAGLDLTFEIEVISARDACSEDLEESYVATGNPYIH